MKTRAAVLTGMHRDFEIVELDVDPPGPGELLLRFVAAGLCHSDLHLTEGDIAMRFPVVGGHEGAGIVETVGPGVDWLAPGDHVVCSFIPNCGQCRYCSTGHQSLCDLGATISEGSFPDHTFRYHKDGVDYGSMCMLGTFSQWATVSQHSVVKVDPSLPLETVVLAGCGVPTGWGTAVYAGGVRAGDTVVVYGIGGVGINAVQGAAHAGARHVIAVDPLGNKRDAALKLGATHAFAAAEEAQEVVTELTRGQLADQALVTVGVVDESVIAAAFDIIGKGGTLVVTGLADPAKATIQVSGGLLTLFEKTIKGSLFGSANPKHDIGKVIDLYQQGAIKLDELITAKYRLEDVNQGYRDLVDGRNIRGVVVHEH
ncbi:MAG: NDMA-dependent alcohol dehydrogenase [Carbonactinosporaceae bacterium]